MIKSLRKTLALCVSLLAAVGVQAANVDKTVYSSDLTDWTEAAAPTAQTIETGFEHQNVTFTTTGNMVIAPAKKINNRTGFVGLEAASQSGTIESSAIASVTTLEYVATVGRGGGNGLKLEVKGDGDADWVTLENTTLTGTSTFTVAVNRTNVKLRWSNITTTKAIYMTDLKIMSNVDESKVPSLASIVINGTNIDAKAFFNEASTFKYDRSIQLSKTVAMIGTGNPINPTAAVGIVQSVTYNGDATQCTAEVVVATANDAVTYQLNATQYVDYTITYYDVDGTTVLGTQQVEDQSAIGSFDVSAPIPVEGYKFRGWLRDTKMGEKATVADIMTKDLALTALVTEVETANGSSRYSYMLNNRYYNNEKTSELGPQERYFYPEDHEAFNPSNASYANKTHGWLFKAGSTLDLLVGGEAYITFVTCSNNTAGTITLAGQTIDLSQNKKEEGIYVAHYTGAAGTLTLTFSNDTYLHGINISNVAAKGGALKPTNGYYEIPANDGDYFLTVLEYLNSNGGNAKMLLTNGVYDLGTTALTPIYADNISIIGQSMNGTIIRNNPPEWNESINITATLYNQSQNLYLQDLTIQNALDYYHAPGGAGRAVTIMERYGSKTICKNVKLLSYQDTYYTHTSQTGDFYWEDSEIHGTVDYICGGGDVIYNRVTFVNESRSATSASGECTVAAPRADNASATDWGYVLLDCRIKTLSATFNYGRSWGHWSRLAYIRPILEDPDKFSAPTTRFLAAGMNSAADAFYEYGTVNADGTPNCPASRVVRFTHATGNKEYETILTDEQAANYTVANIFGEWHPDQIAAQVEISNVQDNGTTVSWTNPATDAFALVAYNEDEKVMTWVETSEPISSMGKTELQSILSTLNAKGLMLRAANGRGGFGPAVLIYGDAPSAVKNVVAAEKAAPAQSGKFFNAAGQEVTKNYKGITISDGKAFIQ